MNYSIFSPFVFDFQIFYFAATMSLSPFQELLQNAQRSCTVPTDPSSKLVHAMPQKYVELAHQLSPSPSPPPVRRFAMNVSTSALSKEASDSVPDRIEGAIAPHSLIAIPGRLVKVHLPNADIRYISGMFSGRECEMYINHLYRHRDTNRWDRLSKGRTVVQWSDPPGMKYIFSDVSYVAGAFPNFVQEILARVIEILRPIYGVEKTCFNYCVCNSYSNGYAGVNWHTDAEAHLVPGCPIACVSFGSERVFSLAKIPTSVTQSPKSELNIRLESGSMVVMAGDTQEHFLHAIAKETSVRDFRFSLTFRVNRR